MILCDTNVLIEFYKNNSEVVGELRSIGQAQLAISVVTCAELYFGALNRTKLHRIQQHLSSVHQLDIDVATSARFVQLMASYSLSHKLAIPDALIAATAIVHGLDLYTLNQRDFQFISDLQLHGTKHS